MDLRRHDLNLLVALEALLDEASVTRAAARLNLSQSAVSATLDRLRHTFNDPILVRAGNRMELTTLARRLQGPLKAALASIQATLDVPREFDPAKSPFHARLALSDYGGLLILPALHRLLRKDAPGFTIEVLPKNKDDILTRLATGDVDLSTAAEAPKRSGLFSMPLVNERFVVAVRRGHPLAERKLTIARMLEFPHVTVTAHGTTDAIVGRAFKAHGHERCVMVTVPVFSSAIALASESELVSIVPERIATWLEKRFDLALLEPPLDIPGYTLHLCWHLRTEHDPAHQYLRQRVLDAANSGNRRHR
ncbi:MAG: LysR family transcriptional regulator [Betaproteobacteria bacterium]|nr:LysR family transcriptional regulator [Betaproteobacteria bacterium]